MTSTDCTLAAFQCCFSHLKTGLQYELSEIVPVLFSKNLISADNRDAALSRTNPPGERIIHLLTVLECRIRTDPTAFNLFLDELDKCQTLQFLASRLRKELERIETDLREEKRGGYDCDFVTPPPDILQTECLVCICTLRNPMIVSCCGNSFCRTCLEQFQHRGLRCPSCNTTEYTAIPEKKLQRLLGERQVWCTRNSSGCKWIGKLCELDEHLSAQCPQRPYSCDYCNQYEATYYSVTNEHHPVCKRYLLRCPNKCDELPEGYKHLIERQNMEYHLKEVCIQTRVVDCNFSHVGCEIELPRNCMSDHISENLVYHMSLLAAHSKGAASYDDIQSVSDAQRAAAEAQQATAEAQKVAAEAQRIAAEAQKALEEKNKEIAQLKEDIEKLHKQLMNPPVLLKDNHF